MIEAILIISLSTALFVGSLAYRSIVDMQKPWRLPDGPWMLKMADPIWLFEHWCRDHIRLPAVKAPPVPRWHVLRLLRWRYVNRRRRLLDRGTRMWRIWWAEQIDSLPADDDRNRRLMHAWYESGVSPTNPARFLSSYPMKKRVRHRCDEFAPACREVA